MLTIAEIKDYLSITNTSYDSFLTTQEQIISEAIEGYCGRVFAARNYMQTFYERDFSGLPNNELNLFFYPVTTLTSVVEKTDGTLVKTITADILPHLSSGNLRILPSADCPSFFGYGNEVVVTYSAGYAAIPGPIKSVLLSLLEERYNKKINGVSLNFGSDVQRISIPGTISIDFDYSLQANERATAFGVILGNYVNVLDAYRSERSVIGSGKISYAGVV